MYTNIKTHNFSSYNLTISYYALSIPITCNFASYYPLRPIFPFQPQHSHSHSFLFSSFHKPNITTLENKFFSSTSMTTLFFLFHFFLFLVHSFFFFIFFVFLF